MSVAYTAGIVSYKQHFTEMISFLDIDIDVDAAQDKKRWVQRSIIKKCLESTPDNYLELITSIYNSQDNSKSNHLPTARPLGDGSLKEDYDTLQRIKHEENNAQIEKDDRLALELLQEEEAQLVSDRERRQAVLLEDTRVAVELAKRLNSETLQRRNSHGREPTVHQKRLASGAPGASRHKQDARAGCGAPLPQKHGILQYFNTKIGGGSSSSCSSKFGRQGASRGNSGPGEKNSGSGDTMKRKASSTACGDHRRPPLQTSSLQECDMFCPKDALSTATTRVTASSPSLSASTQPVTAAVHFWNCSACTFSNYGLLAECEMCFEKKPSAVSSTMS
jgi:hypothetical protein